MSFIPLHVESFVTQWQRDPGAWNSTARIGVTQIAGQCDSHHMTQTTAGEPILSDPRWRAVVARDRAADGQFVYSVRTTGVYCRPSCGARRPNPGNVRFHATPAEATRAGFRACRRCRPDLPAVEIGRRHVEEICRVLAAAPVPPTLTALAARVGLSPHHLHRVFKAATGVTPRAYALALRARRVEATLKRSDTVTDAIYAAGFNSGGRFYETADRRLGMTPKTYRTGGAGVEIRFAVGECSLGAVLVAQSDRGICAILLGDDPEALVRDLQDRFPRAALIGADSDFERIVATVVAVVEAPRLGLDLPLDVRGTAFQQRVWEALQTIPVGATASYTDVAARIGSPTAVRAVARACAANPIAVAIPCHRVVRTDGDLSGYRWGIDRKRRLLAREAAAARSSS
jgi:AraC family transcriptional regulator, regulatory protein of adaptative response / methylated-DNA-[protein]-cysteine methyltransferase